MCICTFQCHDVSETINVIVTSLEKVEPPLASGASPSLQWLRHW